MLKFILSKLAMLIPTFIGVTIAAFVFIRLLPGDPILLMAGERGVEPERYAELQKQFGFDRPLVVQYAAHHLLFRQLRLQLARLVRDAPAAASFRTHIPALFYRACDRLHAD